MYMGRILPLCLFFSMLVSGCLPKSNFSGKSEPLSTLETNPSGIEDIGSLSGTSSSNQMPKIRGTVTSSSFSSIFLYSNGTCTNPILNPTGTHATGSVSVFSGDGIQINVPTGTQISIY